MITYFIYALIGGYALFLLGFAVFMYFENQKFGDNQFTMKLLPPPPRLESPDAAAPIATALTGQATSDWSAMPARQPVRSSDSSAGTFTRTR